MVSMAVLAGAVALSSNCSPSGDVCYGVFKRDGHVSLEITTAARYFGRYTLCVKRIRPVGGGAENAQRCGSFPVFGQAHGTHGSQVNYAKQYPIRTRGIYRVTWKAPAALGPSLRFRLPLR